MALSPHCELTYLSETLPLQQEIRRTLSKFLSKNTTYTFEGDAASGSYLKRKAEGLLRGQGWARSARPVSSDFAGSSALGEGKGRSDGLQVGAARVEGGPRHLLPTRDVRPGLTAGPAPPRRRGEQEGRRPFSQAIKGLGPPRLASASSGSALAAFLWARAPFPLRLHSTFSGLSYSGCGGRWRLRPRAPRRRWLLL